MLSDYYRDLSAEAARILEIARRTYPSGRHVVAIYRSSSMTHESHVFNVSDLQPTVTVKGLEYYLYTVHNYDQWQDMKAKAEAVKRQKETLVEVRKEIDFKKSLGAEK